MQLQPRETSLESLDGVPLSPGQVSFPREGGGTFLDTSSGQRLFYPSAPTIFTITGIHVSNSYTVGGTVQFSAAPDINLADWLDIGAILKIHDKGLIRVENIADNTIMGTVIGCEFRTLPIIGDIVIWVSAKFNAPVIDLSAVLSRIDELEKQIASLNNELDTWRLVVINLGTSVGITLS